MYSASELTARNPVLLRGEVVYEADTTQFKVGDGTTPWNGLPYWGGGVPRELRMATLMYDGQSLEIYPGTQVLTSSNGPLSVEVGAAQVNMLYPADAILITQYDAPIHFMAGTHVGAIYKGWNPDSSTGFGYNRDCYTLHYVPLDENLGYEVYISRCHYSIY